MNYPIIIISIRIFNIFVFFEDTFYPETFVVENLLIKKEWQVCISEWPTLNLGRFRTTTFPWS